MTLATIRTTALATGTPGGAGHRRRPPGHLAEGSEPATRIEGVGELRNTLVKGS